MKEKNKMRFMMIVKANPESESGAMPGPEVFAEMGRFNEEMLKAGVMLSGEGLLPSSKSARIAFDGMNRTVTDGPFAETKELVAGFWIMKTNSLEEAIEWGKRVPFQEGEVEIRQIAETEDFEGIMNPEDIQREHSMREELERRAGV